MGGGGPGPFAPEAPLLSPVPLPPGRRPCCTLPTPASVAPKPRPHGTPGGALGRGPHPRTDRRKTTRTSSGVRASASGSRTRRFSFRRACVWNLARHGTRGGQGRGPGARGRRGEGARSPPRTHDRPVRDVVLAQHGGQLSVRQDRVVVHGGRRVAGTRGRPGAWRRGPSYGCLGARRGQRERLGRGGTRVTPASRPRHGRGLCGRRALCGAGPGREQQPVRIGRAVGAGGAGLTSPDVTNGQDRLEAEGGGACAEARTAHARPAAGTGGAARPGKGAGPATLETPPAGAFPRDSRGELGLRARGKSVGSSGRGSGAGSAAEASPAGVSRPEGRR